MANFIGNLRGLLIVSRTKLELAGISITFTFGLIMNLRPCKLENWK